MMSLKFAFKSSFILLILPFVWSQSIDSTCHLSEEAEFSCVDNIDFFRCRLQSVLTLLEEPNDLEQQCLTFMEKGLCISQPTEMAAYCCKTFSHYCSNYNGTTDDLPLPPTESPLLYDSLLPLSNVLTVVQSKNEELCKFIRDATNVLLTAVSVFNEAENSEVGTEDYLANEGRQSAPSRRSSDRSRRGFSRFSNRYLQSAHPYGSMGNQSALQNSDSLDHWKYWPDANADEKKLIAMLRLYGDNGGEFLSSMLPFLELSKIKFGEVESNLIMHGEKIVSLLNMCGECLTLLIEALFDGMYRIPETPGMSYAQKAALARRNDAVPIQMTASQLSDSLLLNSEAFLFELKKESQNHLHSNLDFDKFWTHVAWALRRTIVKKVPMGGLLRNLFPDLFLEIVKKSNDLNYSKKVHERANNLYVQTFGCPEATSPFQRINRTESVDVSQSVSVGSPLNEHLEADYDLGESTAVRRLENDMSKIFGRNAAIRSLQVESDPVIELPISERRQLQQQQQQQQHEIDASNPKQNNFISDLSSDMKDQPKPSSERTVSEPLLEGQPCIDRPLDFIDSMRRVYEDLSCNDLITAIGCLPERFLLPASVVVEACKHTWNFRCAKEAKFDPKIEQILHVSYCEGQVTSTTLPTHIHEVTELRKAIAHHSMVVMWLIASTLNDLF